MNQVIKIEIEKGYGKSGIGKLIFHLENGEHLILNIDELLRFVDENHQRIEEIARNTERKSVRERFRRFIKGCIKGCEG